MAGASSTTTVSSPLTTDVHAAMLQVFAAQSAAAGNPFLKQDTPPFSFFLGGRDSHFILPHWRSTRSSTQRNTGTEHNIVYMDPVCGLQAGSTLTLFASYPAAEWVVSFENKGTTDTPILEDVQALDIRIPLNAATDLVRLHCLEGDTCAERSFYPMRRDFATSESIRIGQSEGRSSSGAFPFFSLQVGNRGFIVGIGWTGNWTYVIDRGADSVRVRAGMERTHLVLHPGERIRTPRIMLMAWEGDRADAHNQWRRLMLDHCSPRVKKDTPEIPVALQCFDRYVNPRPDWSTEKGQLEYVEAAHRIGCDTVWLDAAWFNGAQWAAGVGNWVAKPDSFPNGLKPISDAAHKNAMRFVLWFEPERVRKDSIIGREHRDYVTWGNDGQGLYKLNDPAARAWLTDLLSKRIDEYGVDIYRNDFNISPTPFWRAQEPPDRQGMAEIRYVEGLYAMWDELLARHPHIFIDNCASGGRRMDIEMMRRSVILWRSDSGCSPGRAIWDQLQMCAVSQYAPLVSIASWSANAYDMRSAATLGIACNFDYLSPDFDLASAQAAVEEVKRNQHYFLGDFYQLTSCGVAPDEFVAWQLDRPELESGIVMGFRRPECPTAGVIVSPRGIDPAATYELQSSDEARTTITRTISGKELSAGLSLRIPGKPGSALVRYRRTARLDNRDKIFALLEPLPDWNQYPSLAEITSHTRSLGGKPGFRVETIGHSRMGRDIELVSFGKGDQPTVLLTGFEDPHEPICSLSMMWLCAQLADPDSPIHSLGYNWAMAPVANPDAVARNEEWFKHPGDLRAFLNWSYEDEVSFWGPPKFPEEQALEEAGRRVKPELAFAMHDESHFPGYGYWALVSDEAVLDGLTEHFEYESRIGVERIPAPVKSQAMRNNFGFEKWAQETNGRCLAMICEPRGYRRLTPPRDASESMREKLKAAIAEYESALGQLAPASEDEQALLRCAKSNLSLMREERLWAVCLGGAGLRVLKANGQPETAENLEKVFWDYLSSRMEGTYDTIPIRDQVRIQLHFLFSVIEQANGRTRFNTKIAGHL